MQDFSETTKSKPSLEQLLQVKRCERPEASFWNEFDQEFRRRQLASLVSKEPWFVRIGKFSLIALRKTAPAAAAVAALTFGIAIYNEQTATLKSPPNLAAIADNTSEAIFIVLPEEQFDSNLDRSTTSKSMRLEASAAKAQPRFATLELNSAASQSRNFTMVTSPFAFAAAANDSGVYVVNDLTTGPVMHVPTSPVGNL